MTEANNESWNSDGEKRDRRIVDFWAVWVTDVDAGAADDDTFEA